MTEPKVGRYIRSNINGYVFIITKVFPASGLMHVSHTFPSVNFWEVPFYHKDYEHMTDEDMMLAKLAGEIE